MQIAYFCNSIPDFMVKQKKLKDKQHLNKLIYNEQISIFIQTCDRLWLKLKVTASL